MLCPGDRALIKPVDGQRIISEAICWWTNSRYSHIEPIVHHDGTSLNITWPRHKWNNIGSYFDGRHRVVLLRPLPLFNRGQVRAWVKMVRNLKRDYGAYDLKSFLGFLLNKPIEERRSVFCSEGTLMADHAAGFLLRRDYLFVTPESYHEFMIAGAFRKIFDMDRPTREDFLMLRGEP